MRLLNIHTFELREFKPHTFDPEDEDVPRYVTASHRWLSDEASYKDVRKRRNTHTRGYKKIEGFCDFVKNIKPLDHVKNPKWIWIDTCCINKDSSAEISEAINSMWSWYQNAELCIAYLADVRPLREGTSVVLADFKNSEWHQRGWTLPELLLPNSVIFLTQEWELIGIKSATWKTPTWRFASSKTPGYEVPEEMNHYIGQATSLPIGALRGREAMLSYPEKDRQSWLGQRKTTKPEDMAYCMLGILDIPLSLIYGEGETSALRRLDDELAKRRKRKRREWPKRLRNKLAQKAHEANCKES